MPKAQFEFAVACGTVFNTLVDKMGRDYDFLMKCLQQFVLTYHIYLIV